MSSNYPYRLWFFAQMPNSVPMLHGKVHVHDRNIAHLDRLQKHHCSTCMLLSELTPFLSAVKTDNQSSEPLYHVKHSSGQFNAGYFIEAISPTLKTCLSFCTVCDIAFRVTEVSFNFCGSTENRSIVLKFSNVEETLYRITSTWRASNEVLMKISRHAKVPVATMLAPFALQN